MIFSFIQVFAYTKDSLSFLALLTREEIGHMSSSPVGIINGRLMEGLRRIHREKKTIELQAVLRICLAFRATDPQDKIFALQGITEAAAKVPLDYHLGNEKFLINAERYFLKRPEALEVFQLAGIGWTEDSKVLRILS
jgi:hypothetical protein